MSTTFSVAVFAHNEGHGLADTIESIRSAARGVPTEITILANGCTDRTVAVARGLAAASSTIHVAEIDLADKANAWNYYVHEISAKNSLGEARLHVFVDGDIEVGAAAFQAFSAVLAQHPAVNAIGAMPSSGRDREAWSRRMVANGTLAGGLYALSGNFLHRIRQRGVRIPRGLIGDDWAVSLFAQTDLKPIHLCPSPASHVLFAPAAGFSFRSLSLWRFKDYRVYLRRLWRYALRGVQYEMLFGLLWHGLPEQLPADVETLYLLGTPPSRLKWVGIGSILRFIAVQKIRAFRTASSRAGKSPAG